MEIIKRKHDYKKGKENVVVSKESLNFGDGVALDFQVSYNSDRRFVLRFYTYDTDNHNTVEEYLVSLTFLESRTLLDFIKDVFK